ncbi:hypothetical protein EXN66_Car011924 [Channa argus]|uniref:Uncharacterized protein n=1 Tax=Channa argus TaxID=215402 RepID=A0A6G1Q1W5_CHAAH|nr:hypothetical protein EXN66_Car011924 [Channa argus]
MSSNLSLDLSPGQLSFPPVGATKEANSSPGPELVATCLPESANASPVPVPQLSVPGAMCVGNGQIEKTKRITHRKSKSSL